MGKSSRSAEGGKRGRGDGADRQPDSASAPASFESALEQLEGTVARLEEGEMPLEEALELFESGVKLSRQCSTTLDLRKLNLWCNAAYDVAGDFFL